VKILCIGPHFEGSTTKMRTGLIPSIFNNCTVDIINTEIPSNTVNRIFKSVGWRTKRGPLITAINKYIIEEFKYEQYDIIWVDKGVFIKPVTIKRIKKFAKILVHFTPDPAFLYHKAHLFNNSMEYYDYFITTKLFEIPLYKKYGASKIIYCTQGFDKEIHQSTYPFSKKSGIVFLGHFERDRGAVIQDLIDNDLEVTVGGINWQRFYYKNKNNKCLNYVGNGVYGKAYSDLLSKAYLGLGFLSKIIPEKHTTRTFEIPACGTALVTEKNEETSKFFKKDEAVFYRDSTEIVPLIKSVLANLEHLKLMTEKGTNRVWEDGYDYHSIMKKIFNQILN